MTAPAEQRSAADSFRGDTRPRRSPDQIAEIILAQLARSNGPVSAYGLASRAAAAGVPLVPNQVYRTLARLIELNLVHRVETLSAYILKDQPFDACLICDHCHTVQLRAAPDTVAQLKQRAAAHGFTVTRIIIETHGRCAACGRSDGTYPSAIHPVQPQ